MPEGGTQRGDRATYRPNAGALPGQTSDTTFGDPNGTRARLYVIQVLYAAHVAQFGTNRVP